MQIFVGTTNPYKVERWRRLLGALAAPVFPEDLGVAVSVVEGNDSTADNAARKAVAWCRACGLPTIADDLGLFIDELDGFPGAAMKTWGGRTTDQATEAHRLALLLEDVRDLGDTGCYLETAVALATPSGHVVKTTHQEPGWIDPRRASQPVASGPLLERVFVVTRFGKPWVEMNGVERCSMEGSLRTLTAHLLNHLP